jgi:hypothetical protein
MPGALATLDLPGAHVMPCASRLIAIARCSIVPKRRPCRG